MKQTKVEIVDKHGVTKTVNLEDWIETTYNPCDVVFEFANEDTYETVIVTFEKALSLNILIDAATER